jgi:hypothetical protein
MSDYYLRFADADECRSVLFDGKQSRYAAVDVIGTIYKPTGNMIQTDDGEVPQMAPIPGYHANVRHSEAAPELDAYAVQVKRPTRVWA